MADGHSSSCATATIGSVCHCECSGARHSYTLLMASLGNPSPTKTQRRGGQPDGAGTAATVPAAPLAAEPQRQPGVDPPPSAEQNPDLVAVVAAFDNPTVREASTSTTPSTGQGSDRLLDAIAAHRGFDGHPIVADAAEIDDIVRDGGVEMWRGVRSADAADNFLNGPYYGGIGDQGNGIYVMGEAEGFDPHEAARRDYLGEEDINLADEDLPAFAQQAIARREEELRNQMRIRAAEYAGGEGTVQRMTLRPGTPIVDFDDVVARQAETLTSLRRALAAADSDTERQQRVAQIAAASDLGRYAAMVGIPAYRGQVQSEVIVLDRSRLIVDGSADPQPAPPSPEAPDDGISADGAPAGPDGESDQGREQNEPATQPETTTAAGFTSTTAADYEIRYNNVDETDLPTDDGNTYMVGVDARGNYNVAYDDEDGNRVMIGDGLDAAATLHLVDHMANGTSGDAGPIRVDADDDGNITLNVGGDQVTIGQVDAVDLAGEVRALVARNRDDFAGGDTDFQARLAAAQVGRQGRESAPVSLLHPGGLEGDERSGLDAYIDETYEPINHVLRGGADDDPVFGRYDTDVEGVQWWIDAVDAAMARSPLPQDVQTWRGIRNAELLFGDSLGGDLTGREWTEDAYVSSTTEAQVARDFTRGGTAPVLMRILVPEGTGAVEMSDESYEAELLLNRGLRMRVVQDRGVDLDGRRLLDVEVIPA